MKLICRIKDEDLGQRSMKMTRIEYTQGACGIVNHEGNIALIHVKNKDYYRLPGGILKEKEDFREGFIRASFEQMACKVEPQKVIGVTEEEKSLLGVKTTSYVFIGFVKEYHEKEEVLNSIEDEVEVEWVSETRALTLVALSYDNLNIDDAEELYSVKFIIKRDQTILEEYIKNR